MQLEIKDVDRAFYETRLADFLPERMIDVHTHVWLEEFYDPKVGVSRSAAWPRLVANENPIEDLLESYRLLLPRQPVPRPPPALRLAPRPRPVVPPAPRRPVGPILLWR